jgi:ribokinase
VRLAVVGHVEWVDFVLADALPVAGAIGDARAAWETAAGGGAMAAYALTSLIGDVTFFCAVGDDARGAATVAALRAAGIDVRAEVRAVPQRRTITYLTDDHERTITTLGPPLEPSGAALPDLGGFDGVVLFGGDASAARAARAAPVMAATARNRPALLEAEVVLDALLGSAEDPTEPLDEAFLAATSPRWVIATEGARGGSWEAGPAARGGEASPARGRWLPARLPSPPVDAFGCGDAFAAAVLAGLADGWPVDRACGLGAEVGARVMGERAPGVGDLAEVWRRWREAP